MFFTAKFVNNQVLNIIFKHFVTSSESQKHSICSQCHVLKKQKKKFSKDLKQDLKLTSGPEVDPYCSLQPQQKGSQRRRNYEHNIYIYIKSN